MTDKYDLYVDEEDGQYIKVRKPPSLPLLHTSLSPPAPHQPERAIDVTKPDTKPSFNGTSFPSGPTGPSPGFRPPFSGPAFNPMFRPNPMQMMGMNPTMN